MPISSIETVPHPSTANNPRSPLLRWALPALALWAGLSTAGCSDAQQGAAPTPLSVVRSATQPSSSQGTQEAKRQGPEPFADCPQFFAKGQSPIVASQPLQRPLCYEAFAILHSGHTKTPVFVAQKLNKRLVDDADEKRTNRFFADARLRSSERAELSDYKGSGYSRGHMAPAGDMPNVTAMAQSFSLANMVPQSQRHNGGAWSKIEKDTRLFAQRAKGDVYVITGPVYLPENQHFIGANKVQVPDYLFKLVYDEAGHRAWAHWHANRDDEPGGEPITYRQLVERTGVNFLPGTGL